MRDGASGLRKNETVLRTSSSWTTWSGWVLGISGTSGKLASARISALPPNTERPNTTDGRSITQSRSRAISCRSPAYLLAEKADGWARSTPTADKWMTRRTPLLSHARNNAPAPAAWTPSVFSRALSCSTPAQLTTASISLRRGSHFSGWVAVAISKRTHSAIFKCR